MKNPTLFSATIAILIGLSFSLASCKKADSQQFLGTYVGTLTETLSGSTYSMTDTVIISGGSGSNNLTLIFQGGGYGASAPVAAVVSGTTLTIPDQTVSDGAKTDEYNGSGSISGATLNLSFTLDGNLPVTVTATRK